CPQCFGPAKLECRVNRGWATYGWTCAKVGHKHMGAQCNSEGWLEGAHVNSRMPFLPFVNLIRPGRPCKDIEAEIEAGYGGNTKDALLAWRRLYQETLGKGAVSLGAREIGGPNQTAVADETVIGVRKEDGTQRATRKLVVKGALKRQPARAIYRNQEPTKRDSNDLKTRKGTAKRAPATRKAAARVAKKPAANLKNAGRWLRLATRAGLGKTARAHAQDGAPRGLGEIKATLEEKAEKGTFLVHDGWAPAAAAAKALGYKSAPPVVHEEDYRDPATGFHANDAESENPRPKGWNRQRCGQLQLDALEMEEYVFYVNVGDTVESTSKGLSYANGGPWQN
ncbi:unnamed protein product, partial [Prorocentrum cordatum]